jgi:ankyrin repeat protein
MRLLFLFLLLSANVLRAEGNPAELLAKACRVGDLKTAEAVLSTGVGPDQFDRYGKTPLYYAASFNQTKIVGLLLAHHANPNDGSLPLQAAAELGNLHSTEMLLAAGAQINAKAPTGRTALHVAVTANHLDLIRFLIERGAELNVRDAEGAGPLDDAVWRGNLDATAILLAHGARLNEAETKTGATPINEAAYAGKTSLIQYLLQFNPDLTIPDKRGFAPLENAIRKGKADSALALLAAEVKEQKTPQFFDKMLGAAIKKDEAVVVSALLRAGASSNGPLSSGATPLDAAASAGAQNVVQIFLDRGADPNGIGPNGTSPLEDAALQGSEPIVRMLLDRGARANQINTGSGTTALYAAAAFGKSTVVALLLSRGADPNLCGKEHKTPYQAAIENGYTEIATQIQQHGGSVTCSPARTDF